jgi:hypothetical protein
MARALMFYPQMLNATTATYPSNAGMTAQTPFSDSGSELFLTISRLEAGTNYLMT